MTSTIITIVFHIMDQNASAYNKSVCKIVHKLNETKKKGNSLSLNLA